MSERVSKQVSSQVKNVLNKVFTLNSKLKANVAHENVKLNHRYTLPDQLSHHSTLPIRQYTPIRPLHATVPFSPIHATVSLPRTRLATLMSFTDRFRPAYPPPLSTAGHQRRSDTASQDIRPCPRQDVTHGRDIPPATERCSEYHTDNVDACVPPTIKHTKSFVNN